MMKIRKNIGLVMLGIFAFFLLSANMVMASESAAAPMPHAGCFGQICGPIQHLLHAFTAPPEYFIFAKFETFSIVARPENPVKLTVEPEIPPPKVTI
jgi:hypothetical protein